MQQIILVIHVLAALGVVSLVLLQHGKGADVGAAFGSGSANTMFGAQGSVPFLLKLTATLAAIFFITSLVLGYMASRTVKEGNSIQLPYAPAVSIPAKKKSTDQVPVAPIKTDKKSTQENIS